MIIIHDHALSPIKRRRSRRGVKFTHLGLDFEKVQLQQQTALQANVPVEKHNDYITWSLISMVIFLPMFIFWVPAFIFSLKSKYKYHKKDIRNGAWYAKISMFYNLCCLILGLLFYLNVMILLPMFVTRNIHYHILVIMVPIVFIYILHLLRYLVVVNA